ncbi:MAG: NUDIX domain-containing protein [Bacteroidota bacterium]
MPVKIFIGNNPLYLCKAGYVLPSEEALELSSKTMLQENYADKQQLLQILEKLEIKKLDTACMLFAENENDLLKEFNTLFKPIDAAGGLVENNQQEIMMIFRKGKWDLPKGKVEHKEKIIDAAKREVEEETGINNLEVESPIIFYGWKQPFTLHTYWENKIRIIKSTYWYSMKYSGDNNFVPQAEEGITEVKWIQKNKIKELLKNSYASIVDVMRFGKL